MVKDLIKRLLRKSGNGIDLLRIPTLISVNRAIREVYFICIDSLEKAYFEELLQ